MIDLILGNSVTRGIIKRLGMLVPGRASLIQALARRKRKAIVDSLFPDLCVVAGPFSGLRYPSLNAHGSALLAKLFGSYEAELHPWLLTVPWHEFDLVIDVGVAEGYYAVGIARSFESIPVVYGYDTSKSAQKLLAEMASLNGVSKRIRIGGHLSSQEMSNLLDGKRGFVVCDCEGFELELFHGVRPDTLANSWLLIECHDHIVQKNICEQLCQHLAKTHECEVIQSLMDYEKVEAVMHDPRVVALNRYEQYLLVSEGRGARMNWICARPRSD